MRRLLRKLSFLGEALRAEATPPQIAWACAIGMAIGLLPKANLTTVGFVMLLFGLRVNLAAGLATAAIMSLFGPLADPFFHFLGGWVLSISPLQGVYRWAADLPIVAWTEFHNTVVAGAAMVGVLQLYPTKRMVELFIRHYPRPEYPRHRDGIAAGSTP